MIFVIEVDGSGILFSNIDVRHGEPPVRNVLDSGKVDLG
jgi:hypothetical protein